MTVGEWKKKRIEEAGGELITYYKIKSSGEYGLCRQRSGIEQMQTAIKKLY